MNQGSAPALGSAWFGVVPLAAALAVPMLILAALARRWLPPAVASPRDRRRDPDRP